MKRLLIMGGLLLASATIHSAEYNLKVDLGDSIRPVTHVAIGSLYGMTESLPANIDEHVKPLKPNVFINPIISGSGHQQPIGDALKVAERIKGTTGKVQLRLADILPGWPYSWKGWDNWKNSVTELVTKKKNSGLTNYDGYEIWNEPYGTWKSENGDFKTTLWLPTYQLLKQLDPNAKIIGPSFAFYSSSRMEDFLSFCVKNNCLPDVISWHQWGSGGFVDALSNLRSLEQKYNISPRKISINEYSSDKHEYEGCPGVSVPFISKFERYGVESAMISWWFVSLPGRLGSLLTSNNEKGGGWYMYKWYGDMDGYMANVTPPNDKSDGIDGFAAVNKKAKEASVVIGGNNTGTVHVNISNVPDFLGSQVNVLVERVTWENKDKAVPAPNVVSEDVYTVSNGQISVPVNVENVNYAYRIYMTSGVVIPQSPFDPDHVMTIPGTIEAENYDLGSAGVAYSDKDKENRGEAYREDAVDVYTSDEADGYAVGYCQEGEWLKYTVDVKEEAIYNIKARLSCGNENVGIKLYIDDEPISDLIQTAPNDNEWTSYLVAETKTTKALPKGAHTLKMEIVDSWINIDRIEFVAEGSGTSLTEIEADEIKKFTVWDISGRSVGSIESTEKVIPSALKNSNLKQGFYLLKAADNSNSLSVVVE